MLVVIAPMLSDHMMPSCLVDPNSKRTQTRPTLLASLLDCELRYRAERTVCPPFVVFVSVTSLIWRVRRCAAALQSQRFDPTRKTKADASRTAWQMIDVWCAHIWECLYSKWAGGHAKQRLVFTHWIVQSRMCTWTNTTHGMSMLLAYILAYITLIVRYHCFNGSADGEQIDYNLYLM